VDCEGCRKRLAPAPIMADSPPPDAFAAIVVAAGKGLRAGQPLPKQFAAWRGKPVVRHSVEALFRAGAGKIVVAIPESAEAVAQAALGGLAGVQLVQGGDTRQQSVHRALEALASEAWDRVLIHDAARPDCPPEVIARLVAALREHSGAIPVLPVVDSIAIADGNMMAGAARREELFRVQTPQAFRFRDILAAHRNWAGEPDAGDDAQVAAASGHQIVLVEGHERLRKLTFAEDFVEQKAFPRTGTGYDVHRLAEGEELWLCGVKLDHPLGLSGHSDADVALHALVDAILGAVGAGDIGQHFPPGDPQWRGAASGRFVEHAVKLAQDAGYAIGNVDITIICEAPKIGPHRDFMRSRVAELLSVPVNVVSIKATTTEGLGFTGRGEGIAAQAVATLVPLEGI
jgi:2-C-methyl-D-erythritol 4-phosphate cytidylyltransferase / 2-C-methyl-D-erythritol 2,4-cyclodiphosphate synthase